MAKRKEMVKAMSFPAVRFPCKGSYNVQSEKRSVYQKEIPVEKMAASQRGTHHA